MIDLTRFKRQREERARAKPRAGLEFGEHKQRRDDRIRHIRRQIHVQAVEAEQPADNPAEQKMKPVERRTTDEQSHTDRARFAHTALPFGAQIVKSAPQRIHRSEHARYCATGISYDHALVPTVSHELAHPEALPLMPVPPRWVDELLGGAAPGDTHHGGVDVRTFGPTAHATTCIADAVHLEPQALREHVASRVSSHHRLARTPWPASSAILELHPRHRRADGRRTRSLHGVQRRPPRCVQRPAAARLGTASAVGIKGSDLSIHCLALEEPGTPVENPRQIPAWQYSARYGPLPPCFSRATIVDLAGRRTLLIGGTASVVGEDSRHAGQFDAQVEETLLNLEALIRAADGNDRDAGAPLHRLVDLRVYVTSAAHAERVRELLVNRCPRARTIAVALAQVCRRELLVEIEGVAEL